MSFFVDELLNVLRGGLFFVGCDGLFEFESFLFQLLEKEIFVGVEFLFDNFLVLIEEILYLLIGGCGIDGLGVVPVHWLSYGLG